MRTIRVIENNYKDRTYTIYCRHCGSVLEVDDDELTNSELKCPCCGHYAHPEKNIQISCEHCGNTISIDPAEVHTGAFGCAYIKCPSCGEELMISDYNINGYDKDISIDNLVFPNDFCHTNKNTGAVEIKPDEIKKGIRRMIKSLRETTNRDDWFRYTSSGDTTIAVLKFDGDEEYQAFVAKDFYTTNIPFEGCDYH